MKKYKYVGDGAGVPGLPHEITDEDAERDGLTELLKSAIENGSYVEVADRKKKIESEVNNGK